MGKKILAIFNILVGPYCVYWAWTEGGVYIPTVLFIGAAMTIFGLVLLFRREKKTPSPQYKDVYVEEEKKDHKKL